MGLVKTLLANYWTTGMGFVLGVLYYLDKAGPTFPTTRPEWMHFIVGALLAGLGAAAKDAVVGSKPGDAPALTVGGAKTEHGEKVLPTRAATPEAKKAVTETGGHVIP